WWNCIVVDPCTDSRMCSIIEQAVLYPNRLPQRLPHEQGRKNAEAPQSQTLSRGIRVLEVLAEANEPMMIADVATALGVHRSIAYRIVRTLEDHGLVVRDASGTLTLGPGMAALARGVSRDLQAAALPELTAVAGELGMTAFLS